MTVAEQHFACTVHQPGHLRASEAYLNRARAQKHNEHLLMLHCHLRLSDRNKLVNCYSHALRDFSLQLDVFDRHEVMSKIRPKDADTGTTPHPRSGSLTKL